MNKKHIFAYLICICANILLFWPLIPVTPTAFADGGAPDLAYIAGTKSGISVIDIQQQKVTRSFALPGDPHSIYLTTDGRFLYVTQPALGQVTMLSAQNGQVNCSTHVPGQPSLLTFDPYSSMLYTAGNGASSVTEFDPNTCAIKQTLPTSGPVYGLAVATTDSGSTDYQLWVSDSGGLEVFDHNKRVATISIPGRPQSICIPPGASAYVATQQGNVYAVSLTSYQVSSPLLTGGQFGSMDYDAYTSQVFVPDKQNKQVDVLTPVTLSNPPIPLPHEPGRVIPTAAAPQSIAITSDGQLGFIALAGGNVAMLNIPEQTITNTFFVGGSPQFVITGLYPPLLGTTPQQAFAWNIVINIVAYAVVLALLIIPIVFIIRRTRTPSAQKQREASDAP